MIMPMNVVSRRQLGLLLAAMSVTAAMFVQGCQPSTPFTVELGPAAPPLGPTPRPGDVDLPASVRFDHKVLIEGSAPVPEPSPDQPLEISVEDAVFLALQNNRALRVQQLTPLIAGTFEQLERAVFDPVVGAFVSASRSRAQQTSAATLNVFSVENESQQAGVDISQFFPTGTSLVADLSHRRSTSNRTPEQQISRMGISLTQALLQGADYQANVAGIRQAQLDTLASQYELRGFAEAIVAQVENTFWVLALAQREIEIFESSLELAQQQLRETEQRVEVGVVAPTELAAARAEVALRREDLINARANLETTRLNLLRLINPPNSQWDRPIEIASEITAPQTELDELEEHVQLSQLYRSEINEARLRLARGQLETVRTRNGLLPRLDLFVNLGKSGYAGSFNEAVRDIDGESFDLTAGINFEYALGNRAAEALDRRARLSRAQAAESLHNLTQLVELDVRTGYIEVQRAAQQVNATIATRELREETLRAETEKFRVGVSTAFLVAQAQRDYLASQIAEVRAVINHRVALTDFYRLDGSLLLRRGIKAPGSEPIEQTVVVR